MPNASPPVALGDRHPPEPFEPGTPVPEPEPPPEAWEEVEPDEMETGIVGEEVHFPGVPEPLPEEEPGEFGDPVEPEVAEGEPRPPDRPDPTRANNLSTPHVDLE